MPRLAVVRRAVVVVVAALVVVAVVVAVAVTAGVRRSLPDRGGQVAVPGLGAQVTVRRDDQGVPQVYADSALDLFAAQGYVTAQDRFFEMDYRRHVTAGRLAELVGDDPSAIEADRVTRTLGWRRVAEQELPMLSTATRSYLQAYADGVNAFVNGRSPSQLGVEYGLLDLQLPDYRVEPWTPVDSLAWLKAMAWDLKGNYADELTRARLASTLSNRRIAKLYPRYPSDHAPIVRADDLQSESATSATTTASADDQSASALPGQDALRRVRQALDAVPSLLGSGDGLGSNAWVVSGAHTTTGRPLLANDPHLGLQVPSTWYQIGLHCRSVTAQCPFDVAGFTFSGLPGVVIGHNARVAWGFTNLDPDVTDFYLERVDGDQVEVDGGTEPLTTRQETLRVRGGADVALTVRSTRHGPILSDVISGVAAAGRQPRGDDQDDAQYDVSLAWTALTPGRTADAVFAIDRATDWTSFRAAARLFDVPSQNMVYADVDGHIGYQAPGRIPVRQSGSDGTVPVPGWLSRYDWKGTVPFEQLPTVLDPAEGFVVTANQQVTDAPEPFLTADWGYGYRSQRIRDLITQRLQRGRISPADMSAIQLDQRNPLAATLVPLLLQVDLSDDPFTAEAQRLLRGWDHRQQPDSAPAAYYNAVWRNLLRLGFDDELPADLAADGGERWFEVVRRLLDSKSDAWWDNRATPGAVENRDEILRQALVAGRLELTRSLGKDPSKWQWGRLHRLELHHPVLGGSGVPAPVRSLVNLDGVAVGGGTGLVDATGWDAASGYQVVAGPSMRMVVDVGRFDDSTWVNLTGASGHPFDAHYDDQLGHWVAGRSYPWPFTEAAVRSATDDEQQLTPDAP
ncbi:penicillin acylase family protein [Angustibacter aerolatus]